MRKQITTALVLLMACIASTATLAQEKIMSYNIRNGRGMDGVCSYQRIAEAILRERPDVVALQEIDSMTNRSQQQYVLGEVATLTGMHGSYAPTYPSPEPKEAIDYITAYKKHARKLKVTSHKVATEPIASDHRPIVVELR